MMILTSQFLTVYRCHVRACMRAAGAAHLPEFNQRVPEK
jgi:hypothetical protein